MWYEDMLGLKVNLEENELIPMGREEVGDHFASLLGWTLGSVPYA